METGLFATLFGDVVRILVVLHVLGGVGALILAPAAMVTKKGGTHHRRWGKIYFWSMFLIFVTALALIYFRPNFFLFMVSILSFYAAFSGYRVLYRKRPDRGERAGVIDWIAAGIALTAGVAFIAWGVIVVTGLLPMGFPWSFGLIGIGFGYFLIQDSRSDLRSFRAIPIDRNWWWYYHIERMGGSYVAAITAFAVQNMTELMPYTLIWVPWVLPAAIGVPLIARTIRTYQARFNRTRQVAA